MKRPSENDEIFGWDRNGFWKDEHIIVSEYLLIFSALLCCSLLIQHFTGHVWKCQYLPEAAATMMLGMTISLTIRLAGGYDISAYEEDHFDATFLGFSPNVFFFAFLPPIIFNRWVSQWVSEWGKSILYFTIVQSNNYTIGQFNSWIIWAIEQ